MLSSSSLWLQSDQPQVEFDFVNQVLFHSPRNRRVRREQDFDNAVQGNLAAEAQSGQPRVKSTRRRPRWMTGPMNPGFTKVVSLIQLDELPASLKHRLEILWGRPVC